MSVKQVLIKAREVIANPENWIQGQWTNEEANCFCAMGAIGKAIGFETDNDFLLKGEQVTDHPAHRHLCSVVDMSELANPFGMVPSTFAGYNDAMTHADVMEAFDKAIQTAKD